MEPKDYVVAMWEGGAAAFKRVDDWSDIDLYVAVQDSHVVSTAREVEEALGSVAPVKSKYEIPQPSWHGHWQALYQLENTSPFLLIDLVILKDTASNRFLEPEIHGQAIVHFDKTGFTKLPPLDKQALQSKLKARVETLGVTFPMFQTLVLKELNRNNDVEAFAFYYSFTLRPLVELLRIMHSPSHHDFYTRFVYHDLPREIANRLEGLFFVMGTDDLTAKRVEAERWFLQTLNQARKTFG